MERAIASGPTSEMAGETFLLRFRRLARFRMTAGCHVGGKTDLGVRNHDSPGFVLRTVLVSCLRQRGALVLLGVRLSRRRAARNSQSGRRIIGYTNRSHLGKG